MPRKYVIEIQNMIASLLEAVSHSIESALNNINLLEARDDIDSLLQFCKDPFQEIKSEHKLLKMLKGLNLYEDPKSKVIKTSIAPTTAHGNPVLSSTSSDIYIMPLCFQFKAIY